jgi:hypothetical protein
MDKASVYQQLSYICSEKYYYKETTSLFTLYRDILEYKTFLEENSSEELALSLNTELECVFIEARYGGNDYDLVYKDCITIVKKIIDNF